MKKLPQEKSMAKGVDITGANKGRLQASSKKKTYNMKQVKRAAKQIAK